MDLFDSYIASIDTLLGGYPSRRFAYCKDKDWEVKEFPGFIMQKESKLELGGGDCASLGVSVTSSTIDISNETLLIGDDLDTLNGNVPFIKIVFIKTKNIEGGEQEIYNAIKQMEYTKYNVNIVGFMARASSINMREEVRVSKKDVKKGLSFERVGNTLINHYLDNDNVEAVKIVFITKDIKEFDDLCKIARTITNAQDALNHIMDNVIIDCNHCNLKTICDEVEGMRDMHIASVKGAK